jgi:hypothetical protein
MPCSSALSELLQFERRSILDATTNKFSPRHAQSLNELSPLSRRFPIWKRRQRISLSRVHFNILNILIIYFQAPARVEPDSGRATPAKTAETLAKEPNAEPAPAEPQRLFADVVAELSQQQQQKAQKKAEKPE